MKFTIGERVQKVFQTVSSQGRQTLRGMAERLGLSKSSVDRHRVSTPKKHSPKRGIEGRDQSLMLAPFA
jgi:FixJ family two-component response regulator